jgi:sialic acid synthase SpsE
VRCQIIAELATNHGGNLQTAKDLISAAADHGADWVKTQTYDIRHLSPADQQYEWFKQSQLSQGDQEALKTHAEARGVRYLTTVFHPDLIPQVKALGCDTVKIGSGESQDLALVTAAQESFKTVFVSVGLDVYAPVDGCKVFACVSQYPAPPVLTFREYMHHGWSDHCVGLDVAKMAVSRGAHYVEKHFSMIGWSRHCAWDMSPGQLAELRRWARLVEKAMSPSVPDMAEARAKYVGRWRYQPEAAVV